MNTHISKELAEWLKDKGCKIKNTHWFVECGNGIHPSQEAYALVWKLMDEMGVYNAKEAEQRNLEPLFKGMYFTDSIPAYSWFDLIVTHAKKFWGEENSENTAKFYNAGYCTLDDSNNALLQIGTLLQLGDIDEAENYVREHSLFSKK